MVENRGDGFLPIVVEREAAETARAALARPVERDDVESRGRDALPDGDELLDERVEAAMDEHGSEGWRARGAQAVRGQRSARVGHLEPHARDLREGAVEQVAVVAVPGDLARGPARREELRDAQIAGRVAEATLALGPSREPVEGVGTVGGARHAGRRPAQLGRVGKAERVRAVQLVVDERLLVEALEADREGGPG